MKNTGIFLIAVVALLASQTPAPLFADDQSDAATTALLTSGQWYLKGKTWSEITTFYPDHTLIEEKYPNAHFTWQIVGDKIVIDYGNHKNTLQLPLDPKGTHGVTSGGTLYTATKIDPAALQPGGALSERGKPAKVEVSPELQAQAADIVKIYHDGLITISGHGVSASGFMAFMGDAEYLVTSAHSLAAMRDPAFKTMDDTAVQPGAPSLSTGADALRLAAPRGGKPFLLMENVDQNAAIGDDVVALGYTDGVVTTAFGKITGIGPSLVQTSVEIGPGDSGSPIVHLKSGKVVAVATYVSGKKFNADAKKLTDSVDKRLGVRLDSVKSWQPVKWADFYAQATAVQELDALTADLGTLYADVVKNGHATAGLTTNPLLKDRVEAWIKDRQQLSAADGRRSDEMFVSFLKSMALTDVNALQPSITCDFFQRKLAGTRDTREALAAAFARLILHTE